MLNMHTAIELLLLYYYFKTALNLRPSCFSLLSSEIAGIYIHIWYMKLFLFWGQYWGLNLGPLCMLEECSTAEVFTYFFIHSLVSF